MPEFAETINAVVIRSSVWLGFRLRNLNKTRASAPSKKTKEMLALRKRLRIVRA